MNKLRLFVGLPCAILLSLGICSSGQTVYSLEQIFECAESNSTQLRPLFTAQEEAEKELDVAKSGKLPDINARLSVGYNGNGFTTKRDFSDYQEAPIPHLSTGLSINLYQPIYTGGAITSAIDIAQLNQTAKRFATELKRDNIRFQLTGFYLDLYKCYNLRKVVENNLASAKKVLSEMVAKYENGTTLRNDITRYELLVSNLKLQLIKLDNALTILNNNLVTVAGLPQKTYVVPDTTILERSLPCEGEEFWQNQTLANAPALKLSEKGVEISKKNESLIHSEKLPKIGLQAGWTIDGPITVEVPPINRNLSYWWVGVGVSYNISSLYKTNKSAAKSRLSTILASEEYEANRENAILAIRADYIKYAEAYEELTTRMKSVELAKQNYDITTTRYSSDMALITDMLDAANSLLEAEQQLVDARINIIYNYYKLLFTSGQI